MLGTVYFVVKTFVEPPAHVYRLYTLLNVLYNKEIEFEPHQTSSSVFDIVTGA
jgi:hypothetical protein